MSVSTASSRLQSEQRRTTRYQSLMTAR